MILITWNIQYGKGVDGRTDFARIVEVLHRLGDADVVCFQELAVNFPDLDGGAGADQPAILAASLALMSSITGGKAPFKKRASALFLYSGRRSSPRLRAVTRFSAWCTA